MGKILGILLLFALIVGGLALWRRARRKHGEQFIDRGLWGAMGVSFDSTSE